MLITDDILEVIEIWKLLFRVRHVDDFRCCMRTFEESILLIEKNRYLSICLQGHVQSN